MSWAPAPGSCIKDKLRKLCMNGTVIWNFLAAPKQKFQAICQTVKPFFFEGFIEETGVKNEMVWRTGRHTPTKNSQEYTPRGRYPGLWPSNCERD